MDAERKTPIYLNRDQTERLAQEVATFLERRDFAKHPHIGLVGPGTRGTEADPLDLLTETVEEQTEQWLSPFVSGFRISLKPSADLSERKIKVCFSFSLRLSAPSIPVPSGPGKEVNERNQFRLIDLCFIVKNESDADASLVVFDGTRESVVYSRDCHVPIVNGQFRIRVPEGDFSDARSQLTTSIGLGYGSPDCARLRFTYGFAMLVALSSEGENRELTVTLLDDPGSFVDPNGKVVQVDDRNKRCRNQGLIDSRRNPWSVAQLQELQSVVRVNGYEFMVRATEHGIAGLRPINCAYNLENIRDGEITLRDYAIVPERGRAIRQSPRTMKDFLTEVLSRFGPQLGMDTARIEFVAEALSDSLRPLMENSNFLFTFQEDCTEKILECLVENQSPSSAVPMGVQTAGGKTLAFLIPICIYALSFAEKFAGVKALLFYPTKALINDQSDTIVKLLWRVNSNVRGAGISGHILTFGILHGDITDKRSISRKIARSGRKEDSEILRLKCPICSSQLKITYKRVGESGIAESVACSGTEDSACILNNNPEDIRFFNSMLRATEESIYASPPDLLVCTPDMVNYRLFFDPSEQSIFGRSIKRCSVCSYSTANLAERGNCPQCSATLDGPLKFTSPKVLVFDEAHQLRGSFGSQVSYVTSRLEEVIKVLGGDRDFRPVYIFSSATLARPGTFVRDFFGEAIPTKQLVRADYVEQSSIVQRVHLFMVPKGYSPEATLVQTIGAAFRHFPFTDRYPNILIFVNSLAEANELIHLLRHHRSSFRDGREHLAPPVINGHSTDYGSTQRTEVEDGFTRGEINVLVATSTLQVGVDFNRIDALIVYGAPFYLSDYVQRIGRAGRKHAALIVNILPSKPIDFFFFGNYPLLTDLTIRDRALDAEAVRISRDNERIRSRSAVKAFLDYLCTRQDSWKYFKKDGRTRALGPLLDALFVPDIASKGLEALQQVATRETVNPELVSYIQRATRLPIIQELRAVLITINSLMNLMSTSGVTSVSELYGNRRLGFLSSIYAGDLRQSDYLVRVEYPDLNQLAQSYGGASGETTRERALAIAIGDYCPGQITSYRSIFFVVDHIESDLTMSGRVRDALYRRQRLSRREDL